MHVVPKRQDIQYLQPHYRQDIPDLLVAVLHQVLSGTKRIHKVAAMKLFGGDGLIGTQTHLPQKFSFSSDFGHFILKMLENAKL